MYPKLKLWSTTVTTDLPLLRHPRPLPSPLSSRRLFATTSAARRVYLFLLLSLYLFTTHDASSCLEKQKGQHTALYAKADALHRGASVAEDALPVLSGAEALALMMRKR